MSQRKPTVARLLSGLTRQQWVEIFNVTPRSVQEKFGYDQRACTAKRAEIITPPEWRQIYHTAWSHLVNTATVQNSDLCTKDWRIALRVIVNALDAAHVGYCERCGVDVGFPHPKRGRMITLHATRCFPEYNGHTRKRVCMVCLGEMRAQKKAGYAL